MNVSAGGRTTSVWKRIGDSTDPDPLIGKWKIDPKSMTTDSRLIIEPWQEGISVSHGIPGHSTLEFKAKFDGRDYPWSAGESPGIITVSLKQVDARAFVQFHRVASQTLKTDEYVLSADGKTLKQTITVGSNAPIVITFSKE